MFANERFIFTTYDKPTHHDYIPDVYKLRWDQPEKFLPDYLIETFNQRMFNNFLHRECFNSCVTKSISLTNGETNCYNNCRDKHLYSMGIFKDVLMAQRKWKGFRNFINLKEYSRTPEEMATNVPTDPERRKQYLEYKEYHKNLKVQTWSKELFGDSKQPEKNIFDYYLDGRFTKDSLTGQEFEERSRKDRYNEYKELSEKYGEKVLDLLKGKKRSWEGIPGEDFVPEDEDSGSAAGGENVNADEGSE
jgi:hypothetical protein